MVQPIFPCLWFNQEAAEAVAFYVALFPNASVQQQNPIVTTFSIHGTKFMALNGGPTYQMSPAVSYFVYCGSQPEIERIYTELVKDGSILMPLGKYDWSPQYAWVQDRFGVNWQLDVEPINAPQKIVPALLFANEKKESVREAREMYMKLFQPAMHLMEWPYPPTANLSEGSLLFTQFKLNGTIMNAMSSTHPHEFDFTHGNSFVVSCETQAEIDEYWEKLGAGGHYSNCGWLVDRYGLSWQIVPTILPTLMNDPEKGPRVMKAFLQMQKFDIDTLLKA